MAGVRQETCCENWCFHTSDAQCKFLLPAVLRESSPGSGRSSAKTTVTGGRAMSPRCSSRNVVLGIPVLMVSVLRGFPTARLSGWASRAQPHGGKRRTNLGFFITAATRRCQPAALDVLKVRLVDLMYLLGRGSADLVEELAVGVLPQAVDLTAEIFDLCGVWVALLKAAPQHHVADIMAANVVFAGCHQRLETFSDPHVDLALCRCSGKRR